MLLFAHKVMLALPGLVKRPGSNDLVWVSHTFSIYGGLRKIRTCGLACRLGRVRTGATGAFPPLRPNAGVQYTMRLRNQILLCRYKNMGRAVRSSRIFVSARQDLNLRPLRPEGLGENCRARHIAQTIVIRTFISFLIDYSIGYSYFKTKS